MLFLSANEYNLTVRKNREFIYSNSYLLSDQTYKKYYKHNCRKQEDYSLINCFWSVDISIPNITS